MTPAAILAAKIFASVVMYNACDLLIYMLNH